MKIDYICETCGSTDVSHDAWADWSFAEQRWVLRATFDYAHCHSCDGKTHLDVREHETPT